MIVWILAVELSYGIGIWVPLALPPEMFSTAQAINAVCLFFVPPYVLSHHHSRSFERYANWSASAG